MSKSCLSLLNSIKTIEKAEAEIQKVQMLLEINTICTFAILKIGRLLTLVTGCVYIKLILNPKHAGTWDRIYCEVNVYLTTTSQRQCTVRVGVQTSGVTIATH